MSLITWFKDLYFTYSLVTNVYMLNAWEAAVFNFFVLLGLYFMAHYTVSFVQAFYLDMAEVNGGTA